MSFLVSMEKQENISLLNKVYSIMRLKQGRQNIK